MALQTWFIYLVAVLGLSITPGPNGLLALTHGALHGPWMALFTILGGVTGFIGLIALAMFGLGALLQVSADALLGLKWVGGCYLVWLGVQLWRAPALHPDAVAAEAMPRGAALFRQGLLAAISNPKVLLFYGAFLPQFIDPERALPTQFLVMALSFAAVEFLVELCLARLAHRIRPWLERGGKRFNRVCGTFFAAIGASLPMTH